MMMAKDLEIRKILLNFPILLIVGFTILFQSYKPHLSIHVAKRDLEYYVNPLDNIKSNHKNATPNYNHQQYNNSYAFYGGPYIDRHQYLRNSTSITYYSFDKTKNKNYPATLHSNYSKQHFESQPYNVLELYRFAFNSRTLKISLISENFNHLNQIRNELLGQNLNSATFGFTTNDVVNEKNNVGGSETTFRPEKGEKKILVQYFSTASNGSETVKQEEITVTPKAKCIYDGYFDHLTDSVKLFLGHKDGKYVNERSIARTAVFNLCGRGLMGMFEMNGQQYFIEPMDNRLFAMRKTPVMHRHNLGPTTPPIFTKINITSSIYKNLYTDENGKNVMQHYIYTLSNSTDIVYDNHDTFNMTTVPFSAKIPHSVRSKRSVSREHFVEVMIVADYEVATAHGSDLQRYILTIMSIVEMIYKHPSIGNAINIILVKIAIFEDSKNSPRISENGETSLANFCDWQYRQNAKRADDASQSSSYYNSYHHDTAVLLTRHDICSNENNCQTLAMTRGTICDSRTSCSIAEDNGLSVALTIAHEIGHNLGIPHDNDLPCHEFETGANEVQGPTNKAFNQELQASVPFQTNKPYYIMAKVLYPLNRLLSWSPCSRHYISSFLDRGLGYCLLNRPQNMDYMHQIRALGQPGHEYSLHQQCQLIYGAQSSFCPMTNSQPCKYLYCSDDKGQCIYAFAPWADGSACGTGRTCFNGECVDKRLQTAYYETGRSVDGNWSEWSEYSPCSRTCGGGVTTSVRHCTNPAPSNGGKFCLGLRSQSKSCNTHECINPIDFRDEQCSAFDGNNMGIVGISPNVKWKGSYDMPFFDRCKLYCREAHSLTIHKLANKVIDGTHCDAQKSQICINGICRSVGCDSILGSNAVLDQCGVCGGDNSTCRTITGTFTKSQYGYNNVARIPAGAVNIDIRQYGREQNDDNYLALMDDRGKYLINGQNSITNNRLDIKYTGTMIQYTGSNTAVERINSTDMIHEDIIVQVLTVGNALPPNIRYSYVVSSKYQKKSQQIYAWNVYGTWKPCSCIGTRVREILCINMQTFNVESYERCQHLEKPSPVQEACASNCQYQWKIVNHTPCSAPCGQGYQHNTVACIKHVANTSSITQNLLGNEVNQNIVSTDNFVIVSESYCQHLPVATKSHGVSSCESKPCPIITHWEYTPWSRCSKQCGGGIRTRDATCKDSFNRAVGPHLCNSTITVLSQICNTSPCPTWQFSEWTPCSTPCGASIRTRQVWCQQETQKLDDRFCRETPKPNDTEECRQNKICVWRLEPWTKCNPVEKCGRGYRTRRVICVLQDTSSYNSIPYSSNQPFSREQSMSNLPQNTIIPIDDNFCLNYGVDAIPKISSSEFYTSTKPVTAEFCEVPCKPSDIHDQISNEIQQQQMGSFNRLTSNRLENKRKLNTSASKFLYNNSPRFSEGQRFSVNDWIKWKIEPWTQCSSKCGTGIRERRVICLNHNGTFLDDSLCAKNWEKPYSRERCIGTNCGTWRMGSWQNCSNPCGTGVQRRYVACYSKTRGIIDERECDEADKPLNQKQCVGRENCPIGFKDNHKLPNSKNITALPQYQYFTTRPAKDNINTSPSNNNVKDKSPEFEKGIWVLGPWSNCSAQCGQGIRHRIIVCRSSNDIPLHSRQCDISSRPSETEKCAGRDCFIWKPEPWSHCHQTSCNIYGYKTRKLQCTNRDGTLAHNFLCSTIVKGKKPLEREPCIKRSCQTINPQTSNIKPLLTKFSMSDHLKKLAQKGETTHKLNQDKIFTYEHYKRHFNDQDSEQIKRKHQQCKRWGLSIHLCRVIRKGLGLKPQLPFKRRKNVINQNLNKKEIKTSIYDQNIQRSISHNISVTYRVAKSPYTLRLIERNRKAIAIWAKCIKKFCRTKFFSFDRQNVCHIFKGGQLQIFGPFSYANSVVTTKQCTRLINAINKGVKGLKHSHSPRIKTLVQRINTMQAPQYFWQMSPWSRCKHSNCTIPGIKMRFVWCIKISPMATVEIVANYSVCDQNSMPKLIKPCRNRNFTKCIYESCKVWQSRNNITIDGYYFIDIVNKTHKNKLKVYCHNMNTSNPVEYIDVPSSNNTSVFFQQRMLLPNEKCDLTLFSNSSFMDEFLSEIRTCSKCIPLYNKYVGRTSYSKLRLILPHLIINASDSTFSETQSGNLVSYASAGDCYSLNPYCIKGYFTIDLTSTNLSVSDQNKWINHGNRPNSTIQIFLGGKRVVGLCGGYCGSCSAYYNGTRNLIKLEIT